MQNSTRKKITFVAISVVCICALWYYQFHILVNIPLWDDFHGIMLPVYNLFTDLPLKEKFDSFFSQNNEHRVANDRFFMLLIYLISGGFQMKILALIGFLNLIMIFILFLIAAKPYVSNILKLCPIIFLIFQAQYYESLQSLMVPFQNFSVILYTFLSFYFLTFIRKFSFQIALFFAIIALYSHGNGILCFIIGAALLVFQRKNKLAVIWIALASLTIFIYFIGYEKPSWTSEISPSKSLFSSGKYTFEFLGSYLLNITDLSNKLSEYGKLVSSIGGFASILLFGFFFFKKYPFGYKNNKGYFTKLRHSKFDLFVLLCFGFIFSTAILIGITRTGFPIFSRYTINSAMLLSLIYIFIITNIKKSNAISILISFITFSVLLISYFNTYEMAIFKKKNAITDGINWKNSGTWVNQYADKEHIERLNPLLNEPYKSGKYQFPENSLETLMKENYLLSNDVIKVKLLGNFLEIQETNEISEKKENGIYYVLKHNSKEYIFPSFHKKNNLFQFLKTRRYFSNQHKTSFPKNLLPSGEYQLYRIKYEGLHSENTIINLKLLL